jgi:hypothetical protein
LFDRVSLRSVESGYLFASLLPVRVFQVLRERVGGGGGDDAATDLATWKGSAARARALASMLVVDGRVALSLARLGIRLPGLSNFAICRKSA